MLLTIIVAVFVNSSCVQKKREVAPGTLDIQSMIQPIPAAAKFIKDTSYIWCGTLVKSHIDQKYHLYYSRWPCKYGFSAWVTSSEVAHTVSNSPFGPFQFKDVVLPYHGAEFWDGMHTHNPEVHFFNGKYYIYYTGNIGDGKITSPQLNWTHRNNQGIGLAIADDPNGPWTRFDKPLIDISADITAHHAQMVANPSVSRRNPELWMEFSAPFISESYAEGGSTSISVTLCDYASAGNTNDDRSRFRVWFAQLLDPIMIDQ